MRGNDLCVLGLLCVSLLVNATAVHCHVLHRSYMLFSACFRVHDLRCVQSVIFPMLTLQLLHVPCQPASREPSISQLLRNAGRSEGNLEGLGRRSRVAKHRRYTIMHRGQQADRVQSQAVPTGNPQHTKGARRVHEPSVGQLLRTAEKNRADLRRLGRMASVFIHQVSRKSNVFFPPFALDGLRSADIQNWYQQHTAPATVPAAAHKRAAPTSLSQPLARQRDVQPQTRAGSGEGKITPPQFWKRVLNKSPFQKVKNRHDMVLERDDRVEEAERFGETKIRDEEEERKFLTYVSDQAMSLHQETLGSSCKESWECQPALICRDYKCSECMSSDECAANRAQALCVTPEQSSVLQHNTCLHKSAFPLAWRDWLQIFVCFFVTIIAAPVGIGGGAILVPIFMYFGSFSAHGAIPLSKATILGGAITNTFLNLLRRHPFSNRPLVDWVSLSLVLPNLLAGTE